MSEALESRAWEVPHGESGVVLTVAHQCFVELLARSPETTNILMRPDAARSLAHAMLKAADFVDERIRQIRAGNIQTTTRFTRLEDFEE